MMKYLFRFISILLISGGFFMTTSTDRIADAFERLNNGVSLTPAEISEIRTLGDNEESVIGAVSGWIGEGRDYPVVQNIEAAKGEFLAPPLEMARYSRNAQVIGTNLTDVIWQSEDVNTGMVSLKNTDEIHFEESGLTKRNDRYYLVVVDLINRNSNSRVTECEISLYNEDGTFDSPVPLWGGVTGSSMSGSYFLNVDENDGYFKVACKSSVSETFHVRLGILRIK